MNRKQLGRLVAMSLSVGSVVGVSLCMADSPLQSSEITTVANEGTTTINMKTLRGQLAKSSAGNLTQDERAGLIFMREEEKLARDVYDVLAAKWGSRPFGNITRAEQSHMDAVKVLLDRFGIPDPAASTKPGEFKDATFQKLYKDLIKAGGASRVEALKVGALIEDLDIFDLDRWKKTTKNEDILFVYANLQKGSRNHLRAFVSNLKNSGAGYVPKYISKEAFDKIIASPMERGGGR